MSAGVGGAATAYGGGKVRLYHDLDLNKYEFLPFIMETTGGLNKDAKDFCKKIRERQQGSIYQDNIHDRYNYERNTLQSAVSIELQRANSRMILERTPILEELIESAMVKCGLAVEEKQCFFFSA